MAIRLYGPPGVLSSWDHAEIGGSALSTAARWLRHSDVKVLGARLVAAGGAPQPHNTILSNLCRCVKPVGCVY